MDILGTSEASPLSEELLAVNGERKGEEGMYALINNSLWQEFSLWEGSGNRGGD